MTISMDIWLHRYNITIDNDNNKLQNNFGAKFLVQ